MLKWLRTGVDLDFKHGPPPPFHQGTSLEESDLTLEQSAFLRSETDRCLNSGAWVPAK